MSMNSDGLSEYPAEVPKETVDTPLQYEDDSGGEYAIHGDGIVGYHCYDCLCETHDCNCSDNDDNKSTGEASDTVVDGIEEDLTPIDDDQDMIDSRKNEQKMFAVRELVIKNICSNHDGNSNIGHVADFCTCAICQDILTDAKSFNCGHTFCDGCIQQYLESEENTHCPSCRTVLTDWYPNYVVRNIVESMKGINNNKNADQTYQPCLMGMSDVILEQILCFVSNKPSELCMIDTTCKRLCNILRGDTFWARNTFTFSSVYRWVNLFGDENRTRSRFFHFNGLKLIRKYQRNSIEEDMLLDVLDGADTFRDVVAHIISSMVYGGTVCLRLRGDAVGYLTQMIQGYVVKKLQCALEIAIHSGRTEVQRNDVHFIFKKQDQFLFGCTTKSISKCDVGSKKHNLTGHVLGCSCNISSSSETVWRWPDDDCHDALPVETGRKIVRRLAYQAGILRMTSDAFVLIEAEILHAIGTLVAHAYELSYNEANAAKYLGEDEELVYDEPTDGIDMFYVPPPPMHMEGNESDDEYLWDVCRTPNERIYTIVPGKIRAAAEERGINTSIVYGDTWISSSDFTDDEERETEKSYYYQPFDVDDEETSEGIDAETNADDDMSEDSTSSDLSDDENDHILNRSDYVDWD